MKTRTPHPRRAALLAAAAAVALCGPMLPLRVAAAANDKNQGTEKGAKDGKAEAKADPKANAKADAKGASAPPAPQKVDLNSATEQQLIDVLKIDAARAREIVKNRPYESADQLVQRMVMSPKDLGQIKDKLTVGR